MNDDAAPLEPIGDDVAEIDRPSRSTAGVRARRRRQSTARSVVEWVVVIVGALAIALFMRTFILGTYYIPSESMEPTLQVGDRVFVNQLSYRWGDVERGQIIVFDRPGGAGPDGIDVLIKRVIGIPGDVVEGRDGVVYRNGDPADEAYLPNGTVTSDFAPVTVPDGELWMMGDNRTNSEDSRVFGTIPIDSVVGRAFVIFWPPGDIGWL